MATSSPPSTLHLPRILCLHGGGTNSVVLRHQARAFIPRLAPYFRLVFADGAFITDAHPDIIPVYENFGPFRMWYRWRSRQRMPDGRDESHGDNTQDERGNWQRTEEDKISTAAIEYQLRAAMDQDDALGATGEWVGLFGFSQGARVAASLLFDRQLKVEHARAHMGQASALGEKSLDWHDALDDPEQTPGFAGGKWRFGVIMAGRGPFVTLSELGERSGATVPATKGIDFIDKSAFTQLAAGASKGSLRYPTVHVHGVLDDGHEYHTEWYEKQFETSTTILCQWDGAHRLPFRSFDVIPIVDAILRAAGV